MAINTAEPNISFENFWSELPIILRPGKVVGKYYGKSLTIKDVNSLRVTIDSPDSGGTVDIQQNSFQGVYKDWRNYRYEKLSSSNTHDVLDIISIIDHVLQTWVRHEKQIELIEKARHAGVFDGVFWLVNYNNHGRLVGPSPVGEKMSLVDVFPDENQKTLKDVELLASSLYRSANELSAKYYDKDFEPREWLAKMFPQFSQDVHSSVMHRANYMAIK